MLGDGVVICGVITGVLGIGVKSGVLTGVVGNGVSAGVCSGVIAGVI